jgi:hypothetical protein
MNNFEKAIDELKEDEKLMLLASVSVTPKEFRNYLEKDGKGIFEIEIREVDFLKENHMNKIEEHLSGIAEIFKDALIEKYNDNRGDENE